jgi:hypothetical protein
MRPPRWGQVSTGRPRVRRISSAHGRYRQRAPVRAGLAGGLVCVWGAAGVSVGAGSGGGMTSGRQGLAGASTPLYRTRCNFASVVSETYLEMRRTKPNDHAHLLPPMSGGLQADPTCNCPATSGRTR